MFFFPAAAMLVSSLKLVFTQTGMLTAYKMCSSWLKKKQLQEQYSLAL